MALVDMDGFQPRTVDKVERLLDLLEEMDRHPALHGKLAMHGGTPSTCSCSTCQGFRLT